MMLYIIRHMSREFRRYGPAEVASVVASVFRPSGGEATRPYRRVWVEFASELPRIPIATEYDLEDCIKLVAENPAILKADATRPYWNKAEKYNPYEIFCTAVQFMDDHKCAVPVTVLPPKDDVEEFIEYVIASDKLIRLKDQLGKLLEISGNLAGAANIGFLAARIMARGVDSRAYPEIRVSPEKMKVWGKKITQFEVFGIDSNIDGPGDTYYFWTHAFAAIAYGNLRSLSAKAMDVAFANGTNVMTFVRRYIARQPTMSQHHEASLLGRNFGLAVVELQKDQGR